MKFPRLGPADPPIDDGLATGEKGVCGACFLFLSVPVVGPVISPLRRGKGRCLVRKLVRRRASPKDETTMMRIKLTVVAHDGSAIPDHILFSATR